MAHACRSLHELEALHALIRKNSELRKKQQPSSKIITRKEIFDGDFKPLWLDDDGGLTEMDIGNVELSGLLIGPNDKHGVLKLASDAFCVVFKGKKSYVSKHFLSCAKTYIKMCIEAKTPELIPAFTREAYKLLLE